MRSSTGTDRRPTTEGERSAEAKKRVKLSDQLFKAASLQSAARCHEMYSKGSGGQRALRSAAGEGGGAVDLAGPPLRGVWLNPLPAQEGKKRRASISTGIVVRQRPPTTRRIHT